MDFPLSAADAPIVMYSLSDSQSQISNKNEPESTKNVEETNQNEPESSKNDEDQQIEQIIDKPPQNPKVSSRKRTRGAKIRSDSSSDEENQEKTSDQERGNLVRRLPASISSRTVEDERVRGRGLEKDLNLNLNLPKNLIEAIEVLSGDFDERKYAEMDILEIAKMKGIVFENPPWWPAEGYPDF